MADQRTAVGAIRSKAGAQSFRFEQVGTQLVVYNHKANKDPLRSVAALFALFPSASFVTPNRLVMTNV